MEEPDHGVLRRRGRLKKRWTETNFAVLTERYPYAFALSTNSVRAMTY